MKGYTWRDYLLVFLLGAAMALKSSTLIWDAAQDSLANEFCANSANANSGYVHNDKDLLVCETLVTSYDLNGDPVPE